MRTSAEISSQSSPASLRACCSCRVAGVAATEGAGRPHQVGAAPAAPPAVQSVQPQEADAGAQVTISGSGLTRITMVTVGGAIADDRVAVGDPASLHNSWNGAVRPTGTRGGWIQCPGRAELRVYGLPAVTAVSANNAPSQRNVDRHRNRPGTSALRSRLEACPLRL